MRLLGEEFSKRGHNGWRGLLKRKKLRRHCLAVIEKSLWARMDIQEVFSRLLGYFKG